MTDLIPFASRHIGSQEVNTVNARDIHAYLGITKTYADWIKAQIRRAHLAENRDYVVFHQEVKNPQGGRPASEHHLTFDAAKHVAMMSSANKGHEVREYFIAKEKELTALTSPAARLERYPELKAIVELVQSTAEARTIAEHAKHEAEEAKAEAAQANANAHRALDTQAFLTIAEYVYIEKLSTKIYKSDYRACSDMLRAYCMDNAIPFRKVSVGGKSWEDEFAFHVSVYAEVIPGWLKRRYAQATLHIIAPEGVS